jgi:hypothetical protein
MKGITTMIHNYDTGNTPAGQTWDTAQLQADFEVIGFSAPFVVVRRRADGQKGSLEFTHSPRVYHSFSPAT